MDSKSRDRMKCVISSILSFLVCLLSFFLIFLIIARITLLNENFIIKAMGKSNFYYQVKNEAEEQMALYEGSSGFSRDFFNDIIDMKMIEVDTRFIVHSIYSNNNANPDVSEFKNTLYNEFVEEANRKGIKVTDETRESLEYFAQTCVDIYLNIIKIPFSNQLSLLINSFIKPVNMAIIVLVVSVLFIGVFIFLIFRWRSLRYYIYALEGELLFTIIVPAIYFISDSINNIPIINQALRNFAIFYSNMVFYQFIYASIIILLLTVVLMVIYKKISDKNRSMNNPN